MGAFQAGQGFALKGAGCGIVVGVVVALAMLSTNRLPAQAPERTETQGDTDHGDGAGAHHGQ
jgi:hypothetical protein